ncbi:hypothetical protein, partial [Klebsiella pneumoniae]|uniref:hypothetical protein n=1 Tax=Klebsiella pneumoniae TaxID=573 RepID=UPI003013D27D
FAREVEQKILAGQLDLVDRDFAGVEKDVVGEKVRQEGEAAGTFETEGRFLSLRAVLDFDKEIAFFETEASDSGLRSDFEP